MSRKKEKNYSQKLINELFRLPKQIYDKRHDIYIKFENDQARSNQSRFEHIVDPKHHLVRSDISSIPSHIDKDAKLKMEKKRKSTGLLYFKRPTNKSLYVVISLDFNDPKPQYCKVKTIYVSKLSKKLFK